MQSFGTSRPVTARLKSKIEAEMLQSCIVDLNLDPHKPDLIWALTSICIDAHFTADRFDTDLGHHMLCRLHLQSQLCLAMVMCIHATASLLPQLAEEMGGSY